MPDDTVEVRITASTADFTGGMATASQGAAAALDRIRVSAADMATAMRAVGNDLTKVTPAMLGMAEGAKSAAVAIDQTVAAAQRATVNYQGVINAATGADRQLKSAAASARVFSTSLSTQASLDISRDGLQGVEDDAKKATSAMGGLQLATAGSTREFIVLGHEILQGRFSRIPGSIMVLASRMGSLDAIIESITPTMVGASAAAVAFAGSLAAIELSAHRAAVALDDARDSFSFNQLKANDAQLTKLISDLALVPGISTEAAGSLIQWFGNIKGATVEAGEAIATLLPGVMRATGKNAETAFKDLAKEYSKALASGDPEEAARQFFDKYIKGIQSQAQRARDAYVQVIQSGAAAEGVSAVNVGPAVNQSQADEAKSMAAEAAAAVKESEGAMSAARLADAASAAKETKILESNYSTQIALARQGKEAQSAAINQAQEGYRQETEAATKAGEAAILAARDQTSVIAADDRLSGAQRISQQANIWRQLLAGEKLTADQRAEIDRTLNQTLVQLARAQAEDAKKASDDAKQAADQQTRALEERGRAAQEAAKRDKEAADRIVADWQRAAADVTKSITDANVEIAKLGEGGGGKGQSLDQRIGSLAEGAKAQLAALKADFQNLLPQGSFDQAIASVSAFNVATGNTSDLMRQLGTTDAATFAAIVQDVDKARVVMADYGEKVRQAQQEAAEQSSRVWTKAFSDIDGSVKTFLSDVIERHKSAGLAAEQAVGKLVTSWVEGIAEIMVKLTAFEALKAASGLGGAIGGVASAGASALGGNVATSLGPSLAGMFGIGSAAGGGNAEITSSGIMNAETIDQLNTALQQTTPDLNQANSGLLTFGTTILSGVTSVTKFISSISSIFSGAGSIGSLFSGAGGIASLASLIPGFAEGTTSAPAGLAMLHAGEIVVPASLAGFVRPMLQGSAGGVTGVSAQYRSVLAAPSTSAGGVTAAPNASGGGGAGGPPYQPNFNMNVSAMDARSVQQMFSNPTTARALAQIISRNSPVT